MDSSNQKAKKSTTVSIVLFLIGSATHSVSAQDRGLLEECFFTPSSPREPALELSGEKSIDVFSSRYRGGYCCLGDANGDQTVDFDDLTSVLSSFGTGSSGQSNVPGDANCDGVVDFNDTTAVLSNFLTDCPGPACCSMEARDCYITSQNNFEGDIILVATGSVTRLVTTCCGDDIGLRSDTATINYTTTRSGVPICSDLNFLIQSGDLPAIKECVPFQATVGNGPVSIIARFGADGSALLDFQNAIIASRPNNSCGGISGAGTYVCTSQWDCGNMPIEFRIQFLIDVNVTLTTRLRCPQ